MQPFVHLHVHSQYSLLDGQASINRIVDKAMNDGMAGIALTDHGAMYGIKEFVNYVKSAKSKIQNEIKRLTKELESDSTSNRSSAANVIAHGVAGFCRAKRSTAAAGTSLCWPRT
jgi:DNA polymerase-3 subunit alpha